MAEEVKLMKFKIGQQLVQDQLHMLYGIMVQRICTELVSKEWQI